MDQDRLFDQSTAMRERRHGPARNDLARLLTYPWIPSPRERKRGLGILTADAFGGDATALYNLAVEYRNHGGSRH